MLLVCLKTITAYTLAYIGELLYYLDDIRSITLSALFIYTCTIHDAIYCIRKYQQLDLLVSYQNVNYIIAQLKSAKCDYKARRY